MLSFFLLLMMNVCAANVGCHGPVFLFVSALGDFPDGDFGVNLGSGGNCTDIHGHPCSIESLKPQRLARNGKPYVIHVFVDVNRLSALDVSVAVWKFICNSATYENCMIIFKFARVQYSVP
jgi:hypothetical protein